MSSLKPVLKNTAHRLTCTGTKWNRIVLIWQLFHRLQRIQPSDDIIQGFAYSHTSQTFTSGKHCNTEKFSPRTQENCKFVLQNFLSDQHNAIWLEWNSAAWGQRWTACKCGKNHRIKGCHQSIERGKQKDSLLHLPQLSKINMCY